MNRKTDQEQLTEEAVGRMIASLDRSLATYKRITRGLDALVEAHQPGAEHFRHEHSKGDLRRAPSA